MLSFEKECWPAEREPFSNFGRRYQRLQITRVPEDCSRAASRCPRLQHTSIVFIDLSPQRWMTFVRRGLGRPPGKLLQSSNEVLGPDAPKRAFPSSRTFCVGAGCHLHRLCLSRLCALPAGQWLRAGPSGMCGRPVVCYRRDCREFLLRGRFRVPARVPRASATCVKGHLCCALHEWLVPRRDIPPISSELHGEAAGAARQKKTGECREKSRRSDVTVQHVANKRLVKFSFTPVPLPQLSRVLNVPVACGMTTTTQLHATYWVRCGHRRGS